MSESFEGEEYLDMVWAYFMTKYGDEIESYRDQCPYELNLNNEEAELGQISIWLLCERKNSQGKTTIDEFVEGHALDKKVASKILQMKDIIHDTFVIQIPPDDDNILEATSKTTGKRFRIRVGTPPEYLTVGRVFKSRIHPWYDDGSYMTTGAIMFQESREEMLERHGFITPRMTDMIIEQMFEGYKQDAESITITARSQAHTLLKRLPAEWINAMYDALSIKVLLRTKKEKTGEIARILTSKSHLAKIVSKLAKPETAALWMVLNKGGVMKYPELCKKAGEDDTQWSWAEESESTVGRLRRRGLLVVGKMRMGSRSYKVAAIPADVVAPLKKCLGAQDGPTSKWQVDMR